MTQKYFIDPFLKAVDTPAVDCEMASRSLRIRPNEYDLRFHPDTGYDQATKRSDGANDAVTKKRIFEEEMARVIPLCSSHDYGHPDCLVDW